ncbi:hypothetical protein DZA52_04710 [Vibrio campbellii]|uniref:Uncharacterized protein n=2 Tax=Vibrio campbellii TaxID=680 RepID=A0AAE9SN15_9VIBR|nr:hypothetical protein DZA52_04710 [Vibrio campbellii]UTZ27727.1 hypothetical protein HB761_13800 [Vibrio campbellii]UTZ44183.1 hypothetical protein HB764_23480 [Vibrio campbellii]
MRCAKLSACLMLITMSSGIFADELLDKYYAKVEECIGFEKAKPDLTTKLVSLKDMEYLPLIRSLRIESCSKLEELNYIGNMNESDLKTTLSVYNEMDSAKLTEEELVFIKKLDKRLQNYNLETDLLLIYEKLKVEQKK